MVDDDQVDNAPTEPAEPQVLRAQVTDPETGFSKTIPCESPEAWTHWDDRLWSRD